MKLTPLPGLWLILASFAIALIFNSLPLPMWLDRFRPDWVAMVLIYWSMVLPERVGIATGWTMGLVQDAARGTLLGQHALALTVIGYLTVRFRRRLSVYPLWQQAVTVGLLLLIRQILVFWIDGVIGYPPDDGWYLAPAIGGMLLWPWVLVVLRDLRRYYHVN